MHKFFYGQKKYAYLDNRNPASETDIVRALFLTNSKTLQHLAKMTGGKENLIKEMKNMKAYYMNNSTGEITENHGEAMKWFRDGNEITLYSRDTNGNFIQRTSWIQ